MPDHTGIYDVTKITNNGANLNAFYTANNSTSPVGSAHFWDEPIWGYYNSEDPWVIRKQIEMFTFAGIDFLVFDCTNGPTYNGVAQTMFDELVRFQNQGWKVPQIVYYLGAKSNTNIVSLYNNYYTQEKYKNLWFSPNGKPMVIGWHDNVDHGFDFNTMDTTIKNYFDFKKRQWPNQSKLTDGVPWMDFTYPQEIYTGSQNDNWINVSPAQHSSMPFSEPNNYNGNKGRGYDFTASRNKQDKIAEGINYNQQWQTAFSKKSQYKYVFITQWNEWVAEKTNNSGTTYSYYFMVDNFNVEMSRDLEPSKTLGDNFYCQTMQNIRQLNYATEKKYTIPAKTINVANFTESQWNTAAVYKDFTGDNQDRNWLNMSGQSSYEDTTGENDIAEIRVLVDNNNLYFRITCVDDISAYSRDVYNWMNILIKTPNGGESDIGYQYIINRMANVSKNQSAICKFKKGDTKYNNSATYIGSNADMYVSGKVMQVAVPLVALGLTPQNCRIEFKVADGVKNPLLDIYSYYTYGDSAPLGRMSYVFG